MWYVWSFSCHQPHHESLPHRTATLRKHSLTSGLLYIYILPGLSLWSRKTYFHLGFWVFIDFTADHRQRSTFIDSQSDNYRSSSSVSADRLYKSRRDTIAISTSFLDIMVPSLTSWLNHINMSEPLRKVGRGGAGNFYTQSDIQNVPKQHEVSPPLSTHNLQPDYT